MPCGTYTGFPRDLLEGRKDTTCLPLVVHTHYATLLWTFEFVGGNLGFPSHRHYLPVPLYSRYLPGATPTTACLVALHCLYPPIPALCFPQPVLILLTTTTLLCLLLPMPPHPQQEENFLNSAFVATPPLPLLPSLVGWLVLCPSFPFTHTYLPAYHCDPLATTCTWIPGWVCDLTP